MKTKLLFLMAFVMASVTYAQWTQLGADIYGEAVDDLSGYSVSLNSDGTILAIGSPAIYKNKENTGLVTIYENLNGFWTKIGSEIYGEAIDDSFGFSVSLSADGTVLAVGASKNDANGINSGHVRIYKNINNVWTQIGSDIDGEATEDESGKSISLNADGTIVAIGAPYNGGLGNYSGQVRVYKNTNNDWVQLGSDIYGDMAYDAVGSSVSLNSDGTVLALGAEKGGPFSGYIQIYSYNDLLGWTQIGSNIFGVEEENYAEEVSISGDGTTVVFGGSYHDANGIEDSGHVRVFKNINSKWVQIGSDIVGHTTGEHLGSSVSINNNGSVIAVGAFRNDEIDIDRIGKVSIYKNIDNNWTLVDSNIVGLNQYDGVALSVSLNSSGNIVAIGSPWNGANLENSGYVRVFQLENDLLSITKNSIKGLILTPTKRKVISNLENIYLTIYNFLGQQIANQNLNKGIYVVKAVDNNGNTETHKILVE